MQINADTAAKEHCRPHVVAIVGLGPKGLYSLERLLAEYKSRQPRRSLIVHVFNRFESFGPSAIYDPQQPGYILFNLRAAEIDLWAAQNPPSVAEGGVDFLTWHQQTFRPAHPLRGDEYLPRAVVGQYLQDGFMRLASQLPQGVVLKCHHGEVQDIAPLNGVYRLSFESADGIREEIAADKILLATGHSRLRSGKAERVVHDFARRHHGTFFIPHVYPVKEALSNIAPGARIAIKGIGLTAIDAILELTEGRGGNFHRLADGSLKYLPNGLQPECIFPFSRSGLPMAPKARDLPFANRPLTFLGDAALSKLGERNARQQLDLDDDLWPLVEAEMQLHYYRVIMGTGPWQQELDRCGEDIAALLRCIKSFHRACPDVERFDYLAALSPAKDWNNVNGAEYAALVQQYIAAEISRAQLGLAGSALKSGLSIWSELRQALNRFIAFGRLNPDSHRKLVEHWMPLFKRVVFGPALVNSEKLLALTNAGLLDFSVARNPVLSLEEDTGAFRLASSQSPAEARSVEVLIDARNPLPDIAQDDTPLYRNLYARKIVRAFENRAQKASLLPYAPGAIDMTENDRFIVGANGVCNKDIAVIGIPTEGNLVGNLTVTRDAYAAHWAALVIDQLHAREAISK